MLRNIAKFAINGSLDIEKVAQVLNIKSDKVVFKMARTKDDFTFEEMQKIQKELLQDYTAEYLYDFEEQEEI